MESSSEWESEVRYRTDLAGHSEEDFYGVEAKNRLAPYWRSFHFLMDPPGRGFANRDKGLAEAEHEVRILQTQFP